MASQMLPTSGDNLRTIFVDSNIDTHLAMVVSLSDTITDLKAKIAAEHALCFQDIGEISIEAIKVKRGGFFYNLADSMLVLNAFERVKGSWFVYIEAVPMYTFKNQKLLPNKVTHECLKHHDYAVPVCSVDKHQAIAFCGLSFKNSDIDGQESHNPSIDHEHRPTMLIDQEKDDRRKDECNNLCIEASDVMPSAACTHKTVSSRKSKASQQENLLGSQSQHYLVEKKKGNILKDSVHEEHLDVCRSGSKFSGSEDIDESNKSANVPQEINCDGKMEILATSSEGLLSNLPHENIKSLQNPSVKKHSKKIKSKSSKSHEVTHLAMSSGTAVVRSPQVTTDPQNSGKEANAPILSGKRPAEPNIEEPLPNVERDISAMHDTASFLEVSNQKETMHSMEVNNGSIKKQILQANPDDRSEQHVNLSQYTNVVVNLKQPGETKVPSQVDSEFPLPSKLLHGNTISIQSPLVEKHTKKRKRKSSKSHEEAHFVLSNGTVVVRSPQLTADSHDLGKENDASIFLGKYPTEPSIEESLANDKRHISTSHDASSLLEVTNKKERRYSLEINKAPVEEHNLQINPEDQSDKYLNSDQDATVDVNLKEPAGARVSSQIASESPTKLYFDTAKSKSQSSKILEPREANDQESRGPEATKYVRDLNFGEAGYVGAKAGISASAEKFPYQEQATPALEGANKDCIFTKVDSKGQSKSQCRRKKSKAESSGVCESTEPKGSKDHFNSDNAQVSLNDAQNESNAAMFIKQADQEANGGHSVDTMIKISSSSKKVPNQDNISNVSSANPPISMPSSMPNNLSEASNAFVEQAAEIGAPSQASSEVKAKPHRSRKKSKSEPSKLGSQENCDAVLPKFNGEVTESNNERQSYPSELANASNQKKDLHAMDAMPKVHLSDENFSKLVKVAQVDPSESSNCGLQDFSEQSNAEIITKGHVSQHEALAGRTKSKRDRKKSKKETLKAQVSSEMRDPMELCRPDESTIKFHDYFVPREGKHSPAVHSADPPSQKSESRKKNKISRKTDESQLYQNSPANLVQPSSYKQHMTIGQPLENDTNNDSGDAIHDTATKDSDSGTVIKAKNTKQSTKQNSSLGRIESDSSLHKAHDEHKLHKKLQNYEPESHVMLSKSGTMGNKHGKQITADGKGKARSPATDHNIDNVVARDGARCVDHYSSTISNPVGDAVGSNKFDVSQSEAMASEATSSDSTEETPFQKKRYRVVRKIPSRKSKKVTNNSNPETSLLVSSGGIFSDASVTSSGSESDAYKKKGAIKTTVVDDSSISGDSESQLEEMQTKASALKSRMETNSFGAESAERGEISKDADGRTKNHSRSDASTQKMPLSSLLKSSMSYRKSKLSASQSEFADAENQPIDVVLETQPESTMITSYTYTVKYV